MRLTTRDITLLGTAISILFVQEQLLTFIPNFQFTTVLLFVYSRVFKFKKTTIIIICHVILDNIYMGSIGMPNIVIPMFMAWMLIPIFMNTAFKKTNNPITLGIIGYLFGHIYGLMFVPFQALILGVDIKVYLIADLPFEFLMGISNLLTIIWLYPSIVKVIDNQYNVYLKF